MNELSSSASVAFLKEEQEDLESSLSFPVLIRIPKLIYVQFPLMSHHKVSTHGQEAFPSSIEDVLLRMVYLLTPFDIDN